MTVLSDAEASLLAEQAFEASMSLYQAPLSLTVERLLQIYPEYLFRERWPSLASAEWPLDAVGSLMTSVARCGYAFRQWEEGVSRVQGEPVPVLAIAIGEWETQNPGMELGAILLAVCSNLAVPPGSDDPWAGMGAVEGSGTPFRELMATRTASALARQIGQGRSPLLPAAVAVDHLTACWRFGYFTRCAATSVGLGRLDPPPPPPGSTA